MQSCKYLLMQYSLLLQSFLYGLNTSSDIVIVNDRRNLLEGGELFICMNLILTDFLAFLLINLCYFPMQNLCKTKLVLARMAQDKIKSLFIVALSLSRLLNIFPFCSLLLLAGTRGYSAV